MISLLRKQGRGDKEGREGGERKQEVRSGEGGWRWTKNGQRKIDERPLQPPALIPSFILTAGPITLASLSVCDLCGLMMMMEIGDVTVVTELQGISGAYSKDDVVVMLVHCASS